MSETITYEFMDWNASREALEQRMTLNQLKKDAKWRKGWDEPSVRDDGKNTKLQRWNT